MFYQLLLHLLQSFFIINREASAALPPACHEFFIIINFLIKLLLQSEC